MIKIKMIGTGEIKEVTRNEAFDLIDRKLAVTANGGPDNQQGYSTRKMEPGRTKKYRIK